MNLATYAIDGGYTHSHTHHSLNVSHTNSCIVLQSDDNEKQQQQKTKKRIFSDVKITEHTSFNFCKYWSVASYISKILNFDLKKKIIENHHFAIYHIELN